MSTAQLTRSVKLDAAAVQPTAISIVVRAASGSALIQNLVHSLERQQQAPPFEVLVVVDQITTALERRARNWDKRIRILQLDKKSAHRLHRFVITEAKGELILFLNDDCVVDDPLFLRRHFDHHQRAPQAAGVGGRYSLKRGAGWSARAWSQRIDDRLTLMRVDTLRCLQLPEYNASYKTALLRFALLHSQIPDAFSNIEVENARFVSAGHDLHLIDRLTVERQIDMNAWKLVKSGFQQALLDGALKSLNVEPKFHPLGFRLSQVRRITDPRAIRSCFCHALIWLHELAYDAGVGWAKTHTETIVAPSSVLLRALFRQTRIRLTNYRYSRAVTELFLSLKTNIER